MDLLRFLDVCRSHMSVQNVPKKLHRSTTTYAVFLIIKETGESRKNWGHGAVDCFSLHACLVALESYSVQHTLQIKRLRFQLFCFFLPACWTPLLMGDIFLMVFSIIDS